MKSIRKLKNATKIAAGSALLVGATLTGAAGLASASNHDTNLGDYPTPFVDEDGEVQSTIVVGESAATIDVVGAINIAGSLGQDAYSTESVSAGSGAAGSWSASNGVTLDTSNDNLYFGDNTDKVRDTLTGSDLGILEETTFTDDSNDETDVTNYLNVGTQKVEFGNDAEGIDDDEDPMLHIKVPAESNVDETDEGHLFNLQANFGDSIDFTDEDVAGEDIELFGTSYQIAEDNTDNSDELLLYGSSESTKVSNGEESTVSIDGEEVTLGVTAVTGSDVAAITVDGELDEYNEDESFTVNGQEVRVDNIIQTSDDQSAGTVVFSIGSQELTLQDGEPLQDSNDDDIEGSYVQFNDESTDTATIDDISSINLYVGAESDDDDYIASGDTFTHSALPGVEFHFGGLNPDATEEGEEITVEPSDDETIRASFTVGDDSQTVEFFNRDTSGNSNELADSDGNSIVAVEGEPVTEDEYFVSDAGDFSHVWEVNSVDRDETGSSLASDAEATLTLRDAVSDSEVEVELEPDGSSDDYVGTEIIDGQTYHFHLDATASDDGSANLYAAWGTGSSADDGGVSTGTTTAFPTVETESGTRVAFYDPNQDGFGSISIGSDLASFTDGTEMYIDDGTSTGYQDGDDVINVESELVGTDLADGDTYRAFASNIRFANSNHDSYYSSDEAILDTSDNVLDSASEVVTAGTADLVGAETDGDIYYYENGDDSSTAAFDNTGEPLYQDNDGTVDSTNSVRLNSVDVVTETNDGTAGNLELQLNTLDHIGTSGTADNDAGKTLNTVSGQFIFAEFEDGANTPDNTWNPDNGAGTGDQDALIYDTDGSGDITAGDILLFNEGNSGTDDLSGLSAGDQFESPVAAGAVNVASSAQIGSDSSSSYSAGDPVVIDVTGGGGASAGDDVVVAPSASSATLVGTYSTGFVESTSAQVSFWDTDGSGGATTDVLDNGFYINMAGDSSTTAGEDVRLTNWDKTLSAGSVGADDVDQDVSLTATESGDSIEFTDSDGDASYQTSEALIYNSGSTESELESSDTVLVSGEADITQFQSGTGTVELYQDGSGTTTDGYDDGEDIVRLSRFGTTSGSAIDIQTSGQAEVTVNNFGTDVKFDDSQGDSSYSDDESIVEDTGSTTDVYDSADTILYGDSGSANVQYWSSDSSETSGVSGLNSILPTNNPGLVVIEEEGEDDVQESYTVSASWDGTDEELSVDSPQFSDSDKRQTSGLESDDDITAGFDQYGVYTEHDSDEQGSFTLDIPYGQSSVGAAVTGSDGSLSAEGGSGSVDVNTPTGFPDSAALDSDSNIESAKENSNMILVGGPAVNALTQELADSGDTWTASEYSEGEGLVQLVNNAFTEGQDALVVAGYSGADTRAAANYIANYADNSDELAGEDQVTVSTQ